MDRKIIFLNCAAAIFVGVLLNEATNFDSVSLATVYEVVQNTLLRVFFVAFVKKPGPYRPSSNAQTRMLRSRFDYRTYVARLVLLGICRGIFKAAFRSFADWT